LRNFKARIPEAAFLLALGLWVGSGAVCWAGDVHPGSSSSSDVFVLQGAQIPEKTGVIHRIEFRGLRRIPAATLRAHITSKENELLDPMKVAEDVRALDRLGWFDEVSAQVEEIAVLLASAEPGRAPADPLLRLVFVVEERPFLAGIEYRGSRVLPRERVAALLEEKGIAMKLAAPVNRNDLWRAARLIEAALADRRHPLAKVHVRLEEEPSAASVVATLEIHDGPEVTVSAVTFSGNQAFSQAQLQRQMKHVAPEAPLAGLRGKDVYSTQRLDADVQRLAEFYRNHGYAEARIGKPVAAIAPENVRHWFPWPRRRTEPRFRIAIPIQEGPLYRLSDIAVQRTDPIGAASAAAGGEGEGAERVIARLGLKPDEPYSEEKIERARDILARLRELRPARAPSLAPEVEVKPQFDRGERTVRVAFDVNVKRPYTVRRIEFQGQKRFSDRYYRRRILLAEGEAFDPEKLERGVAQLTRAGFIRPIRQQDIRAQFDEKEHFVDLCIRVQEIGRQRISLGGGHSGMGGTLGLVYNVFDLLGGEELITTHLEGGPESLQILLGVAKEGVFGTKIGLGLSVYQNVVKPALAGHQRLFTSSSSGLGANWSYPLSPEDTLGINYQMARSSTRYGVLVPTGLAGQPNAFLNSTTNSRRRTLGFTGTHDAPGERFLSSFSTSGGWLGGNENVLRSTLDYSRAIAGNSGQTAGRERVWAFRGFLSGVSSFQGNLPLDARLFAGDELVRGAGIGELGPYALNATQNADGTTSYRATPSGGNLVAGVNTEYRVPVARGTEAAAFFDAGEGWLLPKWLGPDKPALAGTNYNLRGATGVEVKWQVPGIGQTVRVYYALNPFRIRRSLMVADGDAMVPVSLPYRRCGGLGWGLGSLF
jgi:outer membrane protein insertion porin family